MWKRFSTSSPSSTADGSSITISLASRDSARATETICLPAADSVPTSLVGEISGCPNRTNSSRARRRVLARCEKPALASS